MKKCILYTSHRQLNEFDISTEIFAKNSFLQTFDIIVWCNNKDIDKTRIIELMSKYSNHVEIIFSDINSGHHEGVAESISLAYDRLIKYDIVIHTHPDIFFINTMKLERVIDEFTRSQYEFSLWKLPNRCPWEPECVSRDGEYASDFFIIKPNYNNNIFCYHKEFWKQYPLSGCEKFLYWALNKNSLRVFPLDRGKFGPMETLQYPEELGIWHCHDLQLIKKYKV